LKKESPNWSATAQDAFESLKAAMISLPTVVPNFTNIRRGIDTSQTKVWEFFSSKVNHYHFKKSTS